VTGGWKNVLDDEEEEDDDDVTEDEKNALASLFKGKSKK